MTPYSSLFYFLVLIALLVPMTMSGLRGRAGGFWVLVAMAVMLPLQYWKPLQVTEAVMVPEIVALAAFALYQWGLVRLAFQSKGGARAWWLIPLALLPLVVARLSSSGPLHFQFGFSGISYVTFRALDVCWTITDGLVAEVGVLDLWVFLFFFPTISSGPIDRFKRFRAEWRRQRTKDEFLDDLGAGVHAVIRGLFYKHIIAALIGQHVLGHSAEQPGLYGVMEYSVVYSAYLFFDFAGYSAFAVGVSRWFGIKTMENFAQPWAAPNIKEFWNRWHISLSLWFRDHVYMRFLLMAVRRKWFRSRLVASCVALYISFGLMGVWHGLSPHFIIYGLYHATLLSGYECYLAWKKKRGVPPQPSSRMERCTGIALTIAAVAFGFWIFSGNGIVSAK